MSPRRTGAQALVLLAVTVFAGLPWSLLGEHGFAVRDAAFSMSAIDHLQGVLLHGGSWRDAPLAWPLPDGITQTDWMLGQAILGLPLRALLHPVHAYSLLALLGLFLTALACAKAAEVLTGRGPHTLIAGVAGGMSTSQLLHAQHVNLVHHELGIAGLLLAAIGIGRDRPWVAALGGLLVTASFHVGFYMGLHAVLPAAIVAVFALGRRIGRPALWMACLGGALLGALTVAPVAAVYAESMARLGIRMDPFELNGESVDLARILAPIPEVAVHAPLWDLWPQSHPRPVLDPANPGYAAAVLALAGAVLAVRRRVGWPWAAVGAVALGSFLLALGPHLVWNDVPRLPGPYRLAQLLPGVDGLRAPSRWLVVTWGALALFAALAVRELGRSTGRPRLVAGAALGLLVLEMPRGVSAPIAELEPHPVYARVLAIEEPGPLLDIVRGRIGDGCTGQQRLAAQLQHRRPLVGGRFARELPPLIGLNKVTLRWPSPAAAELVRRLGVRVVLEHPPLGTAPLPDGVRCEEVDAHRICVVEEALPGLPPADRLVEDGAGPVAALRIEGAGRQPLQVACGDRETLTHAVVWEVLATLRDAAPPDAIDVVLDTPCEDEPTVSAGGARPLYLAPGASTEGGP